MASGLPVSAIEGPVRALFSDLDGTLTTDGLVEASTFSAIARLREAGVPTILVTGRPAGWGQAIATLIPMAAVVTENGGVTFIREEHGLRKVYGLAPASIPEWRRRMRTAATDVMVEVPGARMSGDSRYREVDLAIDWNEEVHLEKEDALRVVAMLQQQGFTATRSSIHVNFGPPEFDKLSACKKVIEELFDGESTGNFSDFVFVGDALNDAPMFAGFEKSVGVANIEKWWDQLDDKPRYLASGAEGAGLREVLDHVLTLVQ